ncbi:MAG: hypothetical protein LKF35_06000 [Bifidobacterium minimum]|jgi:hypothetical protein|nr:hypothetical protein [Bifidobacterium minimum]
MIRPANTGPTPGRASRSDSSALLRSSGSVVEDGSDSFSPFSVWFCGFWVATGWVSIVCGEFRLSSSPAALGDIGDADRATELMAAVFTDLVTSIVTLAENAHNRTIMTATA